MKNKQSKLSENFKKHNHVIGLLFCILLAVAAYWFDISFWLVLGVVVVGTLIEFSTNKERD